MWLPRPLYEAKPYASIVVGLVCFAVACWSERVAAQRAVRARRRARDDRRRCSLMKRRDYRSTQSDYDPRAIDE